MEKNSEPVEDGRSSGEQMCAPAHPQLPAPPPGVEVAEQGSGSPPSDESVSAKKPGSSAAQLAGVGGHPPTSGAERRNAWANTVSILAVLAWLGAGLYIGLASWTGAKDFHTAPPGMTGVFYKGNSFADEVEAEAFAREYSDERSYPWIYHRTRDEMMLLLATAWGVVGGVIQLLRQASQGKASIAIVPAMVLPLFCGLVGLLVYFLSFLVPTLLTTGTNPPRVEALAALTLLAGAFSEATFQWAEMQFRNILSKVTTPRKKSASNTQ